LSYAQLARGATEEGLTCRRRALTPGRARTSVSPMGYLASVEETDGVLHVSIYDPASAGFERPVTVISCDAASPAGLATLEASLVAILQIRSARGILLGIRSAQEGRLSRADDGSEERDRGFKG
jgi:hypothetical protein